MPTKARAGYAVHTFTRHILNRLASCVCRYKGDAGSNVNGTWLYHNDKAKKMICLFNGRYVM